MKELKMGAVILHSRPGWDSYYIVASAGDSEFVLINLVHGTRASSPNGYGYPLNLDDIKRHMGSLLEPDSELKVLEDCMLTFAIAPTEPETGRVAIGRGE